MCAATAYAKAQGAYVSLSYSVDGEPTCYWWVRPEGWGVAYYNDDGCWCGEVGSYSGSADNICVRPAMWIDLDS